MGARTIFCLRALCFLQEIERRFFDAESTDADASIDRGARKRSKTVEKIIAFAICLHEEIDASRFSVPEQCFAGAPLISLLKSNVVFATPIRSIPFFSDFIPITNPGKNGTFLPLPPCLLTPFSSSYLFSFFLSPSICSLFPFPPVFFLWDKFKAR